MTGLRQTRTRRQFRAEMDTGVRSRGRAPRRVLDLGSGAPSSQAWAEATKGPGAATAAPPSPGLPLQHGAAEGSRLSNTLRSGSSRRFLRISGREVTSEKQPDQTTSPLHSSHPVTKSPGAREVSVGQELRQAAPAVSTALTPRHGRLFTTQFSFLLSLQEMFLTNS